MNEKGEVCCHHFFTKDLKGYWADEKLDDFYILMRETLKPNETLERALERGLMEEVLGQIEEWNEKIRKKYPNTKDFEYKIYETSGVIDIQSFKKAV